VPLSIYDPYSEVGTPTKGKVMEPNGDGKSQYCPRCGHINLISLPVAKCKGCTWKVVWMGPLWGVA
jgi:hypothetical protein